MATGTELLTRLDARSRAINDALHEMNKVISGGSFDPDEIWPDSNISNVTSHVTALQSYMDGLSVGSGVQDAVNTLLDGIPGDGAINKAVKAAVTEVSRVITEATKIKDEIGVSDRIDAFNALNTRTAPGDYAGSPYGLFPAVVDVVNAGTGGSASTEGVGDELEKISAAIAAGDAYTIFVAYGLRSVQFLSLALKTGGGGG